MPSRYRERRPILNQRPLDSAAKCKRSRQCHSFITEAIFRHVREEEQSKRCAGILYEICSIVHQGGTVVRRLLVAVLSAMLLVSCAGPEDLPPIEQAGVQAEDYRLDAGDRLHIQVFNQEQLTGSYTVGAGGSISMPLVGEISVRGLTTNGLEQALVKRLSTEKSMLVDPSISVQVEAYRPFFILGEVKNPGQYPCPYDTTVFSAVAMAGGFTYRARTDQVSITRKVGGETVDRRADRNTVVQPGDVVYVYERYF
jgi:polysaccharide export outer membrane protein